jgi:hypothetical protein
MVVAIVLGVAAAVVAVTSPPGHAVFERVRDAVGVAKPTPAPLVLPAPGRLLVVSPEQGGTWVVSADGKTHRIGTWPWASWSPHGLFIVAADAKRLVALEPNGRVRWSIPRTDVSWPAWEGSKTDTRISYFSHGALRVVAGDGTGDHVLDRYANGPSTWDPGRLHTVTYVAGDEVVERAVDSGAVVWRHKIDVLPTELAWSGDGKRLAIVSPTRVTVLDGAGRFLTSIRSRGNDVLGAAFRPHTHQLVLSRRRETPTRHSEVSLVDADHPSASRTLFAGPGAFGDVAWSPAGAWLLVDWRTANEWLFVRPGVRPRVLAVSRIAQQFPRADGLGPELELANGWCCATR